MSEKIKICKTGDVPDKLPKCIEIEGRYFAVYRKENAFIVIKDECPHQMASFEGCAMEEGKVTCGFHGWTFNMDTGESVKGFGTLTLYPVTVEDEFIYIDFTETEDNSSYSSAFIR